MRSYLTISLPWWTWPRCCFLVRKAIYKCHSRRRHWRHRPKPPWRTTKGTSNRNGQQPLSPSRASSERWHRSSVATAARIWCTAAKRRQWHSCGSWSMRMLAEGNPVARTARKEGTGSPCPMLPSPLPCSAAIRMVCFRLSCELMITDLNGALKLQLCGSADPDFRRKLPDCSPEKGDICEVPKQNPSTPWVFGSSWRPLNWECPSEVSDHQENPWDPKRGFWG